MKVKGIKRDDGKKDYQISHENKSYTAVRNGSLFLCNGMKGTLKEIKDYIASCPTESGPSEEDELETQGVHQGYSTWDCVNPCALLVLLTDPMTVTRGVPDQVYKEVSRTLDNYGWKIDGQPDTSRADREMSRFKSIETGEF